MRCPHSPGRPNLPDFTINFTSYPLRVETESSILIAYVHVHVLLECPIIYIFACWVIIMSLTFF